MNKNTTQQSKTKALGIPKTNIQVPTMPPTNSGNPEIYISWKHFFFKCWFYIHRTFEDPFKERKKELRLLDQVDILISESAEADKVTETCEKYISLHRIVENTKARGRLEKWITRLIACYLFAVLAIILLVALSHKDSPVLFRLSDTVLITILSTTTVNIVALGIILVRGLFHENEKGDLSNEKIFDIQKKESGVE